MIDRDRPQPIISKKKKAPLKPPFKSKDKPYRMPKIDDRLIRDMPITAKQLGSIKKMYGIK